MELLVTYDVATTEAAGQRRLRKIAQVCEAHGQRVQKSVFECTLNEAQHEQFLDELSALIDEKEDSLRVYRLQQPRGACVTILGRTVELDVHDPLIV